MRNLYSSSPINEAVYVLMAKLKVLLAEAADEKRFYLFVTICTNLAHTVAHVEGNAHYIDEHEAAEQIRSFLRSEDFCRRSYSWIQSIKSCTPNDDKTKVKWLSWLDSNLSVTECEFISEEKNFVSVLVEMLKKADSDVDALLVRLGIQHSPGGHDAAFFAISSRVKSSETRGKLYQTWVTAKSRRIDSIAAAVQHLVDARRLHARQTGFATPTERTLVGATITDNAVNKFVHAYLTESVALIQDLSERVRSVVCNPAGLAADFPRFLTTTEGGGASPLFPIDACLGVLKDITHQVFGLTLNSKKSLGMGSDDSTYFVCRKGSPVGVIIFEAAYARQGRVDATTNPSSASTISGNISTELPIAWILYRLASPERSGMTFDSVHTLFHEFGHAIAHILVHDRNPGVSGLDYLPVERLEFLSTWFEKWVYHQALDDHVIRSSQDLIMLNSVRRVKAFEFMRSNLSRAVCAVVDYTVHSNPYIEVREIMQQLRTHHSEIDLIIESELLADFAHPLLVAHPGCSFVYPLASAYSSERMLPLLDHPIDKVRPELCRLEHSVSPNGHCPMPNPSAPSIFYGTVIRYYANNSTS